MKFIKFSALLLSSNIIFTGASSIKKETAITVTKTEDRIIDLTFKRLMVKPLINAKKHNEEISKKLSENIINTSLTTFKKDVIESNKKNITPDILTITNLTNLEFESILNDILNNKNISSSSAFRYNIKEISNTMVEIENTYRINGLFLLSIASHESGWGTSSLSHRKNNLMGIKKGDGTYRNFYSVSESISDAARFLKENYINQGLTDIFSISKKYCPPESNHWANNITNIFNNYIEYASKIN